jgi:hypothetical protein
MILIAESGCAVVKSQSHLGNVGCNGGPGTTAAGSGLGSPLAHLRRAIATADSASGTLNAGRT